MRTELAPGYRFPDFRLPDHRGADRSPAELADGQPLILCFVRGWWCPKEQVRVSNLVGMQEELQREYGRIAVVTVDRPEVNGAFRAGIGAAFPFLSDEPRALAAELDLIEETDAKHRPYVPTTFLLDSLLLIHRVWTGFWFWGNPTPEELRQSLREITAVEQPSFAGGPGIDAPVVWIREDAEGREIQRGAHDGPAPGEGAELGRGVDGRPWLVHAIERDGGRVLLHLRKGGRPDPNPLPQHSIVAPRPGKVV